MFARLKGKIAAAAANRVLLQNAVEEAKKIYKKLDGLKKTIDAYSKQGSLLLLEDLNEDLVKKLQSLTEDNVIVIFTKDGTRMEIKSTEVNYKRNSGRLS